MQKLTKINEEYSTKEYTATTGEQVLSLMRTKQDYDPEHVRSWIYGGSEQTSKPDEREVLEEMMLNDRSRWNTELPEGQEVEISETVYDELLNCLPPHRWEGGYFEVGEPHHHDANGKPVHRACWIKGGRYYTGYPKP